MADLSIIIPTYNRLWCLPDAVESCRATHCSAEIIVVDDGSTDGTWEWLQKQADVRAIRQTNLGKDWAVNLGFRAAKGEFIRFLDSDDWCLAGANDAQIAIARDSGAELVVAGYALYSEDGMLTREQAWVTCDDFIAQQLGECDSSHYSAYLFKREFVADIPHRPDAAFRDDRLFVLELALKYPRVEVYPHPAFAHRHHSAERLQFPIGLRAAVTNYQHLQIYRRIIAELAGRNELSVRRKRAAAKILWPLAHWVSYSHPEDGREVAEWIYQLLPDFQPPDSGVLGWMYRRFGFAATEAVLSLRRHALGSIKMRLGTSRSVENPAQ